MHASQRHHLHRAAIALLLVMIGGGPVAASEPEENEQSLSKINQQLTNPVTSIRSLTF